MRSHGKRLTLAFLLSLCCVSATIFWYQHTSTIDFFANQKPIAQVERVENEVSQRPPTRLLWRALGQGENLYDGQTIRTSSRGSLRIQFEDGRYIDMESDSLVVLKQSGSEIAMDLLEGSLFVNSKASTASATSLVLASKGGKIDLNGSSASVAKSGDAQSNGQVDIRVTQGTAKIRDESGHVKDVTAGSDSSMTDKGIQENISAWKSVSPKPAAHLIVDSNTAAHIQFSWKDADPKWKIELYVGDTRTDLAIFRSTLGNDQNSLTTVIPIGTHWWKFVSFDQKTHQKISETAAQKLEVAIGTPPTAVLPKPQAKIQASAIFFKWEKLDPTAETQIQLFKADNLKDILFTKTLAVEDSLTIPNLSPGTYAWKLASNYENANTFVGELNFFTVLSAQNDVVRTPTSVNSKAPTADVVPTAEAPSSVLPPVLSAPTFISPAGTDWSSRSDGSLSVKWHQLDKAKHYVLIVESTDGREISNQIIESTHFTFKSLLPGKYHVKLMAVDKYDRVGETHAIKLSVPDQSSLQAPTIKRIKVE